MVRKIKNALIRLWVWLTPQAVKDRINSEFMRQMAIGQPRFGQVTFPLVRRINYGSVAQSLIQVEPLPTTHGQDDD